MFKFCLNLQNWWDQDLEVPIRQPHFRNDNLIARAFQVQTYMLPMLELFPIKCLTKLPVCRSNVIRCEGSSTTDGYLKGKRLPFKIDIALPVLSPVPGHRYPTGSRTLHLDSKYFPIWTYICNQDLVEVRTSTHHESQPPTSLTLHPAQEKKIPERSLLSARYQKQSKGKKKMKPDFSVTFYTELAQYQLFSLQFQRMLPLTSQSVL